MITAERLREVLHYDPDTGKWTWLQTLSKNVPKGTEAGSVRTDGRRQIKIDGRIYFAHRLACLWMTGAWPARLFDHRDVDNGNNRWSNLRDATFSQNSRNKRKHRNNTSGLKGVWWNKQAEKWQAEIYADGKKRYLGLFDDLYAAHAAYAAASAELHGEFGRVE
jgi:hypothetical protein